MISKLFKILPNMKVDIFLKGKLIVREKSDIAALLDLSIFTAISAT